MAMYNFTVGDLCIWYLAWANHFLGFVTMLVSFNLPLIHNVCALSQFSLETGQ